MKTAFSILVIVFLSLMAHQASTDVVLHIPSGGGGSGQLPPGSVLVAEDCDNAPFIPCFDDDVASGTPIQDAIDRVEGEIPGDVGPGLGDWSGARHVIIMPRETDSFYEENLECDLPTGHTILEGFNGAPSAGTLNPANPIIRGTTPGSGTTVEMKNCTIRNLTIEGGPDPLDTAIHTGLGNPYALASEMNIENSVIRIADTDLGIAQAVVHLEHSQGLFRVFNSRVFGNCSGACNAATSVIRIEAANGGIGHQVTFLLSEIVLSGLAPLADTSTIEIIQSPQVNVIGSVISCDTSAGFPRRAVNCYEIDETRTAGLDIQQGVTTNGAFSSFVMGRFMAVLAGPGGGPGSIVTLSHIEGQSSFNFDSVWRAVEVRGGMGCSHPISLFEFDPVETGPRFFALDDNLSQIAAGAGVNNIGRGPTQTFRWPNAGGMALGLFVEVDVAPGVGATWTIEVEQDGLLTGAQCVIAEADTTCNGADPLTLVTDGRPWNAGSLLNLVVTPSAGGPPPPPAAAGSMQISLCTSETPR